MWGRTPRRRSRWVDEGDSQHRRDQMAESDNRSPGARNRAHAGQEAHSDQFLLYCSPSTIGWQSSGRPSSLPRSRRSWVDIVRTAVHPFHRIV
jgi:hypothetical protein